MNLPPIVTPDGVQTDRVIIHFLVMIPATDHAVSGAEMLRLACQPNNTQMSSFLHRPEPIPRTAEPRAVTCPLCRETTIFKEKRAEERAALIAHFTKANPRTKFVEKE